MRLIFIFFLVLMILLFGCVTSSYTNLSDVMKKVDLYTNKTITIKGTAQEDTMVKCTMQMCSEDNPCCKTCSSKLLLTDQESKIVVQRGECSGSNCELNCSPLEKGKEYLVTGTLNVQSSKYSIIIESYEEWMGS